MRDQHRIDIEGSLAVWRCGVVPAIDDARWLHASVSGSGTRDPAGTSDRVRQLDAVTATPWMSRRQRWRPSWAGRRAFAMETAARRGRRSSRLRAEPELAECTRPRGVEPSRLRRDCTREAPHDESEPVLGSGHSWLLSAKPSFVSGSFTAGVLRTAWRVVQST